MSQLGATSIDNGDRFQVDCPPLFVGVAGGKADERGGEFACVGKMPQRPVATGAVDGRQVRLLTVRKSTDVAGMLVIRFEYTGAAA